MTTADDTDCSSVLAPGGYGSGAAGNLCFVECSNRGTCDYTSGECVCFPGFSGAACQRGICKSNLIICVHPHTKCMGQLLVQMIALVMGRV